MSSLDTTIGALRLPSPVLTASGTAGHGDELADYGNLADLGAVVVKSLSDFPWPGNEPPRVTASGAHMVNAVGLAGPGVAAWRERDLVALRQRGARVVGSLWGRTVGEFADAAAAMRGADVVAVEVNVSCPNLERSREMFAHSPSATGAVVSAVRFLDRPLWVKLSPNTPRLLDVARAAIDAGADALVLVNTVMGMVIDVERRRAALGNGAGGVSGPGILPIAVRAVYDCYQEFRATPIIGVGGVTCGEDAVSMIMAGACAVEVGTATFANPRAPWRVQRELAAWLNHHHVERVSEIVGAAHRG